MQLLPDEPHSDQRTIHTSRVYSLLGIVPHPCPWPCQFLGLKWGAGCLHGVDPFGLTVNLQPQLATTPLLGNWAVTNP